MTVQVTRSTMTELPTTDNVTITGSEPTAEDYRIFHSYYDGEDVYVKAVRRVMSGDSLAYDAREVLGLND